MSHPQAEPLQAETTWFHVFKTMIDGGEVAKMGPHAFTVYAVIKSHANFKTGNAFPALETIAQKSGMSVSQVKRELKTLSDYGHVAVEKKGRSNSYTLREKVEIQDAEGKPSAVASWDYMPSTVSAAVADLKNVLVTGNLAGARIVHIEHLTVNVANAGGQVVSNSGPGQLLNASELPTKERMELVERMARGAVKTVDKGR